MFTYVVPLPVLFSSSRGFELLFRALSFQPKGFPVVFLVGQVLQQHISLVTVYLAMS